MGQQVAHLHDRYMMMMMKKCSVYYIILYMCLWDPTCLPIFLKINSKVALLDSS